MSAQEVIARALEVRFGTCHNWAGKLLDALTAAGYAVVKLPEPNSTIYQYDDDDGPEDRLGWWEPGGFFGVTQWGYPNEVQLAYEHEPLPPLRVDEARFQEDVS